MLTPRQKQFYDALVELCRTAGRSVHYTTVAKALGVNPFSAYDMLKVLQSKGAVASEYVLEAAAPGPGRSAIMFYPQPRPGPGLQRPSSAPEDEWPGMAQRLLQRLREARETNAPEALGEILSRLSDYGSPLSYCTGVIAALLLNLRLSGQELLQHGQAGALQALVSSREVGLGALAGLSIGASLARRREMPSLEPLLQAVRRFQEDLTALSAESRQKLADFLHDALAAIETTQT